MVESCKRFCLGNLIAIEFQSQCSGFLHTTNQSSPGKFVFTLDMSLATPIRTFCSSLNIASLANYLWWRATCRQI